MSHGRPLLSLLLCAVVAIALAIVWAARNGEPPASASGGASLVFSPAATNLVFGTPVPTVDVSVSNAANISGYELHVSVGPHAYLASLQDAGFLANPNPQGTPQNAVVCNPATVTASYGSLSCSVLALPSPFPPPVLPSAGSTPVALAHAKFTPFSPGVAPIALTAVVGGTPQTSAVLDANMTPLPATLGGGTLTISGTPPVGGIGLAPVTAALVAADNHGRSRIRTAALAAALALLAASTAFVAARRRKEQR
jgi:hypothetical protein